VIRTTFPVKYLGLPLSFGNSKGWTFHHTKIKWPESLSLGTVKKINVARRGVLVITSQMIFHLTPLITPPGCFHSMKKIQCAFLWVGTREISGGKCMIICKVDCRPKFLGGLGILHLEKFARAL
jgi:hypothetical protein